MLSQSFRWRVSDVDAFLDYGPVNVANVQRFHKDQGFTLTIRWQGKAIITQVGSIRQGVRYAERWIAARPGWPGRRPERWYDRIAAKRSSVSPLGASAPPRYR